jgi:hypothetical protein
MKAFRAKLNARTKKKPKMNLQEIKEEDEEDLDVEDKVIVIED